MGVNRAMNQLSDVELIEQGNTFRESNQPLQALECYAKAFVLNPDSYSAWNNYGNVIRELGFPERSIPFLQHAYILNPSQPTAQFNLAVSYLLMGDYQRGWDAYESRWNYEHLAGMEPKFDKPKWQGQDLKDKKILVVGEQGHGDNIQFSRFIFNIKQLGAEIFFQTTDGLVSMFPPGKSLVSWTGGYNDTPPEFDYWVSIMSIPRILNLRLNTIPQIVSYLGTDPVLYNNWLTMLGPKNRMRIGFSWSGRRDSWINRHKGMPLETFLTLVDQYPEYEWISLQIDASPEEEKILQQHGVSLFRGAIKSFADTAALIMHLDIVISVDTAIAHLSGALGRPTWIMLSHYGVDWRWLLNRDSSPWYTTAKLFRQPSMGDWNGVFEKIKFHLKYFKV